MTTSNDRLTNQRRTSSDQERETSPPGGMSGDQLQRQAGWQGQQQSATALKEQQDADVELAKDAASKIDDGGTSEKT